MMNGMSTKLRSNKKRQQWISTHARDNEDLRLHLLKSFHEWRNGAPWSLYTRAGTLPTRRPAPNAVEQDYWETSERASSRARKGPSRSRESLHGHESGFRLVGPAAPSATNATLLGSKKLSWRALRMHRSIGNMGSALIRCPLN